MIEKINGKEEKGMSPLTKMLVDMKCDASKEGETKGKIEAMISAAKKMLKGGEEDEKIIQYTGISRQKIEELKKEIQKEQIA